MNKTMQLFPATMLLASLVFAGAAGGQAAGALAEADPGPDQAAVEGEQPAAEAPPPGKPSVLVLNVQPAAGVTEDTTKLLDDLVAVHMDTQNQLEVTAYNDVKQLIELEGEKQAVGCEEAACLADIAGAMGARFVISGRLGKLGSRYLLTFTLFDSEAADNLARVNVNETSLDVVTEKIAPALNEVVAAIPGASGKAEGNSPQTKKPANTAASTSDRTASSHGGSVDGAVTASTGEEGGVSFGAVGGTAAVAALGTGLMMAGVAFDQVNFWMLEGANNAPDPLDFVGVGFFAVGGLVALASLGFAPFWYSSPDEGDDANDGGA